MWLRRCVAVSGCFLTALNARSKGGVSTLGTEFETELKDRWHYWKLAGAFLGSLHASQSFKLAQYWHVRKETLLKVILMV